MSVSEQLASAGREIEAEISRLDEKSTVGPQGETGPAGPVGPAGPRGEPGTGGGGGGLTLTVAGKDAPARVKARADYVCNGTDDQLKINEALKEWGLVRLAGTFSLSGPISVGKERSHLSGYDGMTVLNAQPDFIDGGRGMIEAGQHLGNPQGINIRNLRINGNKHQHLAKVIHGIKFSSYGGTVLDVEIVNVAGDGLSITSVLDSMGKPSHRSTDAMFRTVRIRYARDRGIVFGPGGDGEDTHLMQCVVMHTGKQGTTIVNDGAHGIHVSSASIQFESLHLYGNTGAGLYFNNPSARSKIVGSKIEMNNGGGFLAPNGAYEIQFAGCNFRGGRKDQINIGGSNASKVHMTGIIMSGDNPVGTSADRAIVLGNRVLNSRITACLGGGYLLSPTIVDNGTGNVLTIT